VRDEFQAIESETQEQGTTAFADTKEPIEHRGDQGE
jgi:hypothetical protein